MKSIALFLSVGFFDFFLLVLDLILIHLILLQSKLGFNTYSVDNTGKCFILKCSNLWLIMF